MVQGADNDTAGIIQKQVIACYNFAWLSDEKSYNKAAKMWYHTQFRLGYA
jgi:hypothetical protein